MTSDAKPHTPTVSAVADRGTDCCKINRSKVRRVCPSQRTDREETTEKPEQKKRQPTSKHRAVSRRLGGVEVEVWGRRSGGLCDPTVSTHNPFIMPLHNTHLFFETSQNLLVMIKAKLFAGTMSDTPCYLPVIGGSFFLCVVVGGAMSETHRELDHYVHLNKPPAATRHPVQQMEM